MRKYLFIAAGGFLGAIIRYLIKYRLAGSITVDFPINTLLINITGCFVLAFFLVMASDIWKVDAAVKLGVATGFLGAYTTFSTLCKETVMLLFRGEYVLAGAYIVLSIVLGLLSVFLGLAVARYVTRLSNGKETGLSGGAVEIVNNKAKYVLIKTNKRYSIFLDRRKGTE